MSTAIDTGTVEMLDFSVNIECEHPRHPYEGDLHNLDNPAAVALLGRMCPSCEGYLEFYVCNDYLIGLLNGRLLICLDCGDKSIGPETIVKLEYL